MGRTERTMRSIMKKLDLDAGLIAIISIFILKVTLLTLWIIAETFAR
jgi:hypothetical protein